MDGFRKLKSLAPLGLVGLCLNLSANDELDFMLMREVTRSTMMSKESMDYVRRLVKLGADVNQRDSQGRTPLHLVIEGMDRERAYSVAATLTEFGADLGAKDDNGNTPLLSLAVSQKIKEPKLSKALINLFVLRGADIKTANDDGEDFMSLALSRQQKATVCKSVFSDLSFASGNAEHLLCHATPENGLISCKDGMYRARPSFLSIIPNAMARLLSPRSKFRQRRYRALMETMKSHCGFKDALHCESVLKHQEQFCHDGISPSGLESYGLVHDEVNGDARRGEAPPPPNNQKAPRPSGSSAR